MTLSQSRTYIYSKEYPLFCLWAVKRGILFLPRELSEGKDMNETFDLMSKIYILMKRMGQNYDTLMRIPSDDFNRLFDMEMECIRQEEEEMKKNK